MLPVRKWRLNLFLNLFHSLWKVISSWNIFDSSITDPLFLCQKYVSGNNGQCTWHCPDAVFWPLTANVSSLHGSQWGLTWMLSLALCYFIFVNFITRIFAKSKDFFWTRDFTYESECDMLRAIFKRDIQTLYECCEPQLFSTVIWLFMYPLVQSVPSTKYSTSQSVLWSWTFLTFSLGLKMLGLACH